MPPITGVGLRKKWIGFCLYRLCCH